MVRINIINPKLLSDQHLVAEYNEILMLLGYVRKYPTIDNTPSNYDLGEGHIKFFKNKLLYLKKRHQKLSKEMNNRNFVTNKKVNLEKFPENLKNDWKPNKEDFEKIKHRLIEKINLKDNFYRYHGKIRDNKFFIKSIKHFYCNQHLQ